MMTRIEEEKRREEEMVEKSRGVWFERIFGFGRW
jgi:hypothetical protein